MSKRDLYIKASSGADEWVRPEDWLPMPTNITEADDIFVGLYAIFPEGNNFAAFRFTISAGQYQVDWGDGTVELFNSNVTAERTYDYASISNSTLSSRGYKQVIITVTPVSGLLRTCNFQFRRTTTPAQNQHYATGFLDCILSMPNANSGGSIVFGGATVRHSYCERMDIKTIGGCTTTSQLFSALFSLESVSLFDTSLVTNMDSMFVNCGRIKQIPLYNTSNVTVFSAVFAACISLTTVPLFNTASATTFNLLFNECRLLKRVPLFNTQNVNSYVFCFNNCASLEEVPLFNTQNATIMAQMFQGCSLLKSVPLFNTQNVTNTNSMFNGCSSLQSLPFFNTQNVTNAGAMFVNCFSLQNIPALSTASITASSGTDFGNFANSCNSLDRCEMVFARSVSFTNCQLSQSALVEIFNNLVNRTSTTSANINITGNWGASALTIQERDIALNKNWTITG